MSDTEWESVTLSCGGTLSTDFPPRTEWVDLYVTARERVALDPSTGRILMTVDGVGMAMSVNRWLRGQWGS